MNPLVSEVLQTSSVGTPPQYEEQLGKGERLPVDEIGVPPNSRDIEIAAGGRVNRSVWAEDVPATVGRHINAIDGFGDTASVSGILPRSLAFRVIAFVDAVPRLVRLLL